MALGISFFITILSFIICILLATLIGKSQCFSFLWKRKNRFESIDGIRGFLALSVFYHHFVITYYWKLEGEWQRPPEDIFQNFGKVGVAIFFMITGFLFFSRIMDNSRPIDWFALYRSRFFRIYPLYLFAICLITFVVFTDTGYQLNVSLSSLTKEYIKWALFIGGPLNEFTNTRTIIAGVDWTLKYEWLFYFSLPLIFIMGRTFKVWGLVFLGGLSLILYYKPVYISYFSSFYLIFFAIGSSIYYLRERFAGLIESRKALMSSLSLVLMLLLLIYPTTFDSFHIFVMSILFLLIASGCNIFGILSTRGAILLGEISYSIYLLHGIILYLIFTVLSPIEIEGYTIQQFVLFLPCISIIVVLTSIATFLLIEKPAMDAGKVKRTRLKIQ